MQFRKRRTAIAAAVVATAAVAAGTVAVAVEGDDTDVTLSSFEEVPALSSAATATFQAKIAGDAQSIETTLKYQGLESAITQAHIHFGQSGVNGGISLFLCTNLGNGPAGTPPCPDQPGTVTRTLVAADVVGPAAQGIAAGELAEVVKAIRAGAAYVNVHTTGNPGGEIRAQLNPPPGPAGPTGPAGAAGAAGPTGPAGARGKKGKAKVKCKAKLGGAKVVCKVKRK